MYTFSIPGWSDPPPPPSVAKLLKTAKLGSNDDVQLNDTILIIICIKIIKNWNTKRDGAPFHNYKINKKLTHAKWTGSAPLLSKLTEMGVTLFEKFGVCQEKKFFFS